MVLLRSSFSLVLATLGATIALNITTAGPKVKLPIPLRPVSGTLHLDPLPNPYHVPGTSITLFFAEHRGPLVERDVLLCLRKCTNEFITYVRTGGDRPIASWGPDSIIYGSVEFSIQSAGLLNPPIMYNDTFAVLDGISTKMSREGYWHWRVQVFRTAGHIYLGDAAMSSLLHLANGLENAA